MIKVTGLRKKYSGNTALNGISFEISGCGVYGFLGPNGAGKSTTMNIITGCLAADEGEVKICGYDIFEDAIKAKSSIGYLPENPPLYSDMSVKEYLTFVAKAKGLSKVETERELAYLIERTSLTAVTDKLICNLSKGYKQRVGIAQAMLGNPEVIILDEPTVGLDPKQIIEIRSLIRDIGEEHTVIFSSHILTEVQELCKEVVVISEGRIVAQDTVENLCRIGDEHPTLRVCVKCEPFDAMSVCDEYEEITHYAITESGDITEMVLTLDSYADIRERLFWDFSGKGIAILSMSFEKQSLEETYMKLTSPVTVCSEEEEQDDEENTYLPGDGGADDYIPLFKQEDDE